MLEIKGKNCKDCKIYADTIEEAALSTIYSICDHPAFKDQKIRIMPDVHQGIGIVVGFSSTLGKYINPAHIGTDCGCTVTSIILEDKVKEEDYPIFEKRLKDSIPMGACIHESITAIYNERDLYKELDNALKKAATDWPEMIEYEKVDEKYIEKLIKRINIDPKVFYKSIGTIGSGNHFIEYGEGEYNRSEVGVITIHSGSRALGFKIFKYWETESYKIRKIKNYEVGVKEIVEKYKNDKTKIPEALKKYKEEQISKHAPNGYLEDDNFKGYLKDMVVAQAYAKFNHKIIGNLALEIYKKINKNKVNIIKTIQSTHNYINFSDHIIRKGAVQALKGQELIIPFNMRDGLAICVGKGNEDWNYTCPHGAGRIMSRSKAKENIKMEDFEESMKGIYSTSVIKENIDESPMAYKNKDEIIELIEPTVDIVSFIKPRINIKSSME